MPSLFLFGRRWNIGTDDFVFPGVIGIAIRTWALILLVQQRWVWNCPTPPEKENGYHLDWVYMVGSSVTNAVFLAFNVLLTVFSCRGGMFQPQTRCAVPFLLYVRYGLIAPDALFSIFGIILFFLDTERVSWVDPECKNMQTTHALRIFGMAHFSLALDILWVAAACCLMDLSQDSSTGSSIIVARKQSQQIRKWRGRLQLATLNCFPLWGDQGATDAAINDLAELMSHSLSDADWVWTDFLAIFFLAHLEGEVEFALPKIEHHPDYIRPADLPAYMLVYRMGDRSHDDISPQTVLSVISEKSDSKLGSREFLDTADRDVLLGAIERKDGKEFPVSMGKGKDVVIAMEGKEPSKEASSSFRSSFGAPVAGVEDAAAMPSRPSCGVSTEEVVPEWKTISLACRYMHFSICVSLMTFLSTRVWLSRGCGLEEIISSCFHRSRPEHLRDRRCCRSTALVFSRISGIPLEDILYLDYRSAVFRPAHLLIVDRETKTLVLVIRATLNPRGDVLTDASGRFDRFECPGFPSTVAHHGINAAASILVRELQERGVLEKAKAQFPTYPLVVTGHSLGGGTSVLVSALLRPSWPSVRCYAFSPPPVISQQASEFAKAFVMTVLLADDHVCRISVWSLNEAKYRALKLEARHEFPKWSIICASAAPVYCRILGLLQRYVFHRYSKRQTWLDAEEVVDGCVGKVPSPDEKHLANSKATFEVLPRLYLPGSILQIRQVPLSEWQNSVFYPARDYEFRWAECTDPDFATLKFSFYGFESHLPVPILYALKKYTVGMPEEAFQMYGFSSS